MEILNNIILGLYEDSQHCPALNFNDHVLNKLKKLIPFESAAIVDFSVTSNQNFYVKSLHPHAVPAEKFFERQKLIGEEKLNPDGSLNSKDTALKIAYSKRGKSAIINIKETFLDADVLVYCKKFETSHSLTFVSDTALTGSTSVVSLWRASNRNEYQGKHEQVANILLPHIVHARKINASLNNSLVLNSNDSSTALANFEGCLHFIEEKAIRLLQLEWKEWTPPFLPPNLMETLKKNKENVLVGNFIQVKASLQGNMICLVIAPISSQRSELSKSEYRVAKLAIEGLQYKEIAKILSVSPATVRNQLHSVYKKLSVSNKTALALALSL